MTTTAAAAAAATAAAMTAAGAVAVEGPVPAAAPPAGAAAAPPGDTTAGPEPGSSLGSRRLPVPGVPGTAPLAVDARLSAGGARRRSAVGHHGEALAAAYLEDAGWQILERNWRPEPGARRVGLRGELDIIALDPGQGAAASPPCGARGRPALVVVEVKTRTSLRHGYPAEAVSPRKMARLRSLVTAWAATHSARYAGIRIDVVSVLLRPQVPAVLRHHRGAVL